MTDVVSTERAAPSDSRRYTLQMLAHARAVRLARPFLPPSHQPVPDVISLIWIDGLGVGLQMVEPSPHCGLTDGLSESLYAELEGAKLCSHYGEFEELDDPAFQALAYQQVSRLGATTQPIGHPEVTWDMVEIWTDGVAAALRVAQDRAHRSA